MAVNPLVTVEISLQTTGVARADFGTLIFIGSHRWFSERVRTYASLTSAVEDGIDDASDEYQALLRAFQQSPAPRQVKIGRREADVTLTPTDTTQGVEYTISVGVNDGDSVDVTYTVGAAETEENIVDAIKAAIDGDANVAAHVTTTKNGTGASTTLTIDATTASDYFVLSGISSNLSYAYSSTETAADLITAIDIEDSGYYCVTAHDHTPAFIEAMADVIEAQERMYFVSVGTVDTLSAYSLASTDILAVLKQNNYLNTAGMFYHDADTDFPEVARYAYQATYTPGDVTWTNNQINGLGVSRHPTTGLPLTLTQQNYVNDRNASWITTALGVTITRGGNVAGGKNIETIRVKHYWIARLREGVTALLVNQQGSKLGYSRHGIGRLDNVVSAVSDALLTTDTRSRALDEYKFSFPRPEDVPEADKIAGVLNVPFYGVLTGAIEEVVFTGTLSFTGLNG